MFAYCNNNPANTLDNCGKRARIPIVSVDVIPINAGQYVYYVNITLYRLEGNADEIDVTVSHEGAEITVNDDKIAINLGMDAKKAIDCSIEKEIIENALSLTASMKNGAGIKITKDIGDTLTLEVTITMKRAQSKSLEKNNKKSGAIFPGGCPGMGSGANAVFGSPGGVYANQMGGAFTPVWGRNYLAIV